MLYLHHQQENPRLLSPLTLAYVGDAVYELCARQTILAQGERPVNDLHRNTVGVVQAAEQSQGLSRIEKMLSEEELAIYKRGRNASPHTVAKTATTAQYHRATGMEALFGYLYLQGRTQRIWELFFAANPQFVPKKDSETPPLEESHA